MTDQPEFDLNAFPERERDNISVIQEHLYALNMYAGDFESALGLFDFCVNEMTKPEVPGQGPEAPELRHQYLLGKLKDSGAYAT
jgi:hypothetical protein